MPLSSDQTLHTCLRCGRAFVALKRGDPPPICGLCQRDPNPAIHRRWFDVAYLDAITGPLRQIAR